MTAKEYLQQMRDIDIKVNLKQKELEKLYASITSITSNISPDIVQGSKNQDRLGEAVANIIDLQNEINADIDKLISLKRKTMRMVDKLPAPLCQLVYLRYFQFLTWEKIAEEMNYSCRQVIRLHEASLIVLEHTMSINVIECQ